MVQLVPDPDPRTPLQRLRRVDLRRIVVAANLTCDPDASASMMIAAIEAVGLDWQRTLRGVVSAVTTPSDSLGKVAGFQDIGFNVSGIPHDLDRWHYNRLRSFAKVLGVRRNSRTADQMRDDIKAALVKLPTEVLNEHLTRCG